MASTDLRASMLELVQRANEKQSRNKGRVPYWTHLLALAQIVERTLDATGEMPDPAERGCAALQRRRSRAAAEPGGSK